MQLSNPSVLSVHLKKRLSYSEFQVKTDYYCLELLITTSNSTSRHWSSIQQNNYEYIHTKSCHLLSSSEFRSIIWIQKQKMKKNQWNNKKMIPWSVNFFSLHCEYCHFVGWSCVMALLSTHSNQFASKCARIYKFANLAWLANSKRWSFDIFELFFMLCHLHYVSNLITPN